jgi:hypothetical protein
LAATVNVERGALVPAARYKNIEFGRRNPPRVGPEGGHTGSINENLAFAAA